MICLKSNQEQLLYWAQPASTEAVAAAALWFDHILPKQVSDHAVGDTGAKSMGQVGSQGRRGRSQQEVRGCGEQKEGGGGAKTDYFFF